MKTILITGADGFIGRNLRVALSRRTDLSVLALDLGNSAELEAMVSRADVVFHLAGVNRPTNVEDFATGNVELTRRLVAAASSAPRPPAIVFSSSIHAITDHPYGVSKRQAEAIVFEYGRTVSAPVYVYRFEHVFGKWCRPNYNSVVATFCHNLARGLDISIHDPDKELELLYIDTVVESFLAIIDGRGRPDAEHCQSIRPTYRITVGELARRLRAIADVRTTSVVPDLADDLTRYLHATYTSYLDPGALSYPLGMKVDNRGFLAEIIKSPHLGQLFVSRSHKGVIRGNHYHDTKVEKFCVLTGKARIKLRHLLDANVISYEVSGDKLEVVDIPPGYTHSITNVGDEEMVVLFWANEAFDPSRPDTYMNPVEGSNP
jgi:UDP-2-acetamido-2,6-beta-L-arabino-hexul-4-ose reductase